mmetsp:Transcript_2954/g.9015  ORF Transcript_2954/g.9015 Transcript_2954/m.9015 type:complete len:283 (+) Transcript_2954:953-1801(+)
MPSPLWRGVWVALAMRSSMAITTSSRSSRSTRNTPLEVRARSTDLSSSSDTTCDRLRWPLTRASMCARSAAEMKLRKSVARGYHETTSVSNTLASFEGVREWRQLAACVATAPSRTAATSSSDRRAERSSTAARAVSSICLARSRCAASTSARRASARRCADACESAAERCSRRADRSASSARSTSTAAPSSAATSARREADTSASRAPSAARTLSAGLSIVARRYTHAVAASAITASARWRTARAAARGGTPRRSGRWSGAALAAEGMGTAQPSAGAARPR